VVYVKNSLKSNKTMPGGKSRWAFFFFKKRCFAEAQKVFDDALALNNSYRDALTGKGIVLARMGKDKKAEGLLQKALVLNPSPVRTHYGTQFSLRKKKRLYQFRSGV
jgi:Tfp pilus assembly protein PilF